MQIKVGLWIIVRRIEFLFLVKEKSFCLGENWVIWFQVELGEEIGLAVVVKRLCLVLEVLELCG